MKPFEEAISIINKKNLGNFWLISSVISAFDYFSGFPIEFPYVYPLVNQSNTIMFTRAILYSRSNNYRKNVLNYNELTKVINQLNDASDRSDIRNNPNLDAEKKLAKIISAFSCSQLLFTKNNLYQRIGILYALYFEIPSKYMKNLKEKHKKNFIDIPNTMKDILGIDIDKYFILSLYLLMFYNEQYRKFLDPNPIMKKEIRQYENNEYLMNIAKEKYLAYIISHSQDLFKLFTFKINQLNFFSQQDIQAFLNITNNTTDQLRELNKESPYQKGHISERLSPLERYPIVRIASNEFIIPNFRYYDLAITGLLRFVFQTLYKDNQFNEVMGSNQEYFLNDVFVNYFQNIQLITEKEYKRKRSSYKGPDFTLIEKNKMIVIESKAKHILLDTRLSQDSENLITDLDSSFKALKKLKDEKIPDLFSGLEVYCKHQKNINKTKDFNPICIIIIGQGVNSLQEYIEIYKKKHPKFFLNKFNYPYCFIDILTFCKGLDIALSNNISLNSLFSEYWETGNNLNPKKYSSDNFKGREIEIGNSILIEYLQKILAKTKSYDTRN